LISLFVDKAQDRTAREVKNEMTTSVRLQKA
jgi:hypothetical protein